MLDTIEWKESDYNTEIINSISNTDYIRKVDKSKIPVCNILGVNIAAIDMKWTMDFIKKYIKDLSGDYICVSNVHTTIISYEDPKYCIIQNSGIMALPDGGPLSSFGRKHGHDNIDRVTGPDLMSEILKISTEQGYRHYFYGSTEVTLEKLNIRLQKNYPGIQITGMYSPPFRPVTMVEDEEIVNEINETNSDFVWIGIGAPKQERWMAIHQGKIKGLMIGVGAGFDYHAGNIKRAPKWMQRSNMEWFYRLMQDPRRLFNRYLKNNIKFLWLVLRGN